MTKDNTFWKSPGPWVEPFRCKNLLWPSSRQCQRRQGSPVYQSLALENTTVIEALANKVRAAPAVGRAKRRPLDGAQSKKSGISTYIVGRSVPEKRHVDFRLFHYLFSRYAYFDDFGFGFRQVTFRLQRINRVEVRNDLQDWIVFRNSGTFVTHPHFV